MGPVTEASAGRRGAPRREVALGDGRTLLVRHLCGDDLDGLAALYDGLDDEARHRRFFSSYRPDRSFFERLAAIEDRGGAGLVAVVTDPAGGQDLVAEASYELLPDGDGELAITVGAGWRGWLGPFLLDALLEVAAERGVPDLEADVLATNGPMLAMARQRGWAMAPREGWSEVRVLISTTGRTPRWPDTGDRPRVLVEGSSGHWHGEAAERAGLAVLACPGPGRPGTRCPVLDGDPCPLAQGADVIVLDHPRDDERWSALRAAHPSLHAGFPVCVELHGDDAARAGESAVDGDHAVEAVLHLARPGPPAGARRREG